MASLWGRNTWKWIGVTVVIAKLSQPFVTSTAPPLNYETPINPTKIPWKYPMEISNGKSRETWTPYKNLTTFLFLSGHPGPPHRRPAAGSPGAPSARARCNSAGTRWALVAGAGQSLDFQWIFVKFRSMKLNMNMNGIPFTGCPFIFIEMFILSMNMDMMNEVYPIVLDFK